VSGDRETFLQRVREAVARGNRAGAAPPTVPERGSVGYQGAGPDPVARFAAELTAAGGVPHVVADIAAARETVLRLVRERSAARVLLSGGPVLDTLALRGPLEAAGVVVVRVDEVPEESAKEEYLRADLGISGVDYAVAETGSLAVRTRPDQPRAVSLFPPVHVAVVHVSQLVPDLFDLFERQRQDQPELPACLSLITGPSKTGDIELRLVTGVHGPGEVHVVLVTG
jgi:L-lactate dehydrogenase complex protein LldG